MDITQTITMMLPVSELHPNTGQMEVISVHANPRQISETEYAKLVASMREDNLTGILQEKVYKFGDEWIVLDGNMRLRALRELGIQEVQCLIVPENTPAKVLEKIIILSNSTFGEWDMNALANWDEPLDEWGVDVPKYEGDQEPENLDGEAKEKPFVVKVTFGSPDKLKAFLAKYQDMLKEEYGCVISISGGEI